MAILLRNLIYSTLQVFGIVMTALSIGLTGGPPSPRGPGGPAGPAGPCQNK